MVISDSDYKSIISLIRSCGKALLSAHGVEEDGSAITVKGGVANFVTFYDVKTQNVLIDGFKKIIPDACFFAEEQDNSYVDYNNSLCFFIDPIDGTTNFIHDMKMSAVSVALSDKGEVVFGAVYNPWTDEMFSAKKGSGAFLNDKRITVSDRSLDKALVAFGTAPYDREILAKDFFPVLYRVFMNCADIRRSGSAALDICYVACGRTDAFFETVLSPWDFAAGKVIVEEAGGKVTSFDGKELSAGKKTSVLCTNNVLHEIMLGLINK